MRRAARRGNVVYDTQLPLVAAGTDEACANSDTAPATMDPYSDDQRRGI